MLTNYLSQCTWKLSQSTGDDATFYQSEIDFVQERLDLLNAGNREKIDAHSYEKACDWVSYYALPDKIADSPKLLWLDDGVQYISNTTDGRDFVGYMVEVRLDNGDVASMYGSYAVQFSTTNIYEYDVVANKWTYNTSLNLLNN